MIFYVRPRVVDLTPERIMVMVPLRRRNKNYLINGMYFGALSVGADCAGGLLAFKLIREEYPGVTLVFKNFRADFLKRADGDVLFTCTQGKEIARLVAAAARTGERVEMPVEVVATVPDRYGDEPVARFILTLSLKKNT